MWNDPIVTEDYQTRERLAAAIQYDVKAIFQILASAKLPSADDS
jgi:hypothetical protein